MGVPQSCGDESLVSQHDSILALIAQRPPSSHPHISTFISPCLAINLKSMEERGDIFSVHLHFNSAHCTVSIEMKLAARNEMTKVVHMSFEAN